MKTKLILGSLLALAGISQAQNTFPASGYVGIGTLSPADPLHVFVPSGVGYGGIRVTNLSTTGTAWLRLQASGTNAGDFVVGSESTGNFIIHDARLGISTTRFVIDPSGNAGIGTLSPSAKLDVTNAVTGSGGYYGIKGILTYAGSSNNVLTGVDGEASSSVHLYASCLGVIGKASGGKYNYGGFFNASGDTTVSGHQTYGVYSAVNAAGANDWAGYFVGKVYTSASSYVTSDRKLKKNIQPLMNGLDRIKLLKPSAYEYRNDEFKNLGLPEGKQMGLIAQDLETVFPELVANVAAHDTHNDKGEVTDTQAAHKAVNYIGLIPVLISGMQEQQTTIEAQQKTIAGQQKQLDEQQQAIAALTAKSSNATGMNANTAVETGFHLSQNEPNPFTHETVVNYALPQTVATAFMAVYDLTGKQLATFPITEKGTSSLTLTSEKLAAGIYIYSIIADGKVVDSKRMIVAGK